MFTWTADWNRQIYDWMLNDIGLDSVKHPRYHDGSHSKRVAQRVYDAREAFWSWKFAFLKFFEEFPEFAFSHKSVWLCLSRKTDCDAGDVGLFASNDLHSSVSDVGCSERYEKFLELVPNRF